MISRLINQRYEILERIGEGPYFQVNKTRDKVIGRVVAVKTLLPAYAEDFEVCESLRQAAAGVLDLSHPSIARLYDIGEEGKAPFLVTEFVRGINLKERVRRIAPFTLSVAVDFAIAVGEALQHAHASNVIHGDLRPQNVIVSPEGAVKVTDFGIQRAFSVAMRVSSANAERAAPYQAPELALGGEPTVSTDLYSLGVILFEMLTGGLPFPGESAAAIAQHHRTYPVPSPRQINPGVPRSLEGIVMKSLQKHSGDRYRTASDLLNDLKSVRDALRFGKPLSWSPLESDPHAGLSPQRNEEAAPMAARPPVPLESVLAVAPDSGYSARMSATSVRDDRISPVLRFGLYLVAAIAVVASIVLAAVWMAMFTKPPEKTFPMLVGMKVEEARAVAERDSVRLIEHEEFSEKFDAGRIYRTDWPAGRPVAAGRRINVWVSKGSRMVWVPSIVKENKEDAEKKLKEAGLTLGEVDRQYSNQVAFDNVMAQNPRAGKRVNRDSPVNLQISDGPNPASQPPEEKTQSAPDTVPSESPNNNPPGHAQTRPDENDAAALEPNTIKLTIKIPHDYRGERRVRVEYDDQHGTHTPIDETHGEGDTLEQSVDVYGAKITVRVYYGDDMTPAKEFVTRVPRKRR